MDIFRRLEDAVNKVARVHDRAEASAVSGLGVAGGSRRRTAVGNVSTLVQQMPDDAVNQLLWQAGQLRQAADALIAVAAAETAARTDGQVARLAGLSSAEAAGLARVGEMVAETERVIDAQGVIEAQNLDIEVDVPWWQPIAIAVVGGRLSAGSATVLRDELGEPTEDVSAEQLSAAAEKIVDAAGGAGPDDIAALARHCRAELEGELVLIGDLRAE